MTKPLFTAESAWAGGFYELAIEIGPRSDERLQAALEALWSHVDLDGCFLDRDCEPSGQMRVPPNMLEDGSHLLGVAKAPNGSHVVCGTCVIREVEDGADWLDFYLPTGSLGHAYMIGGYPFGDENDEAGAWRYDIEDWLAGIGLEVAKAVSMRLGLIGFEVSGRVHAPEIAETGIPAERDIGFLWPTGEKIEYYRRTHV
jgi:hypothetical protein